MAPKQGKTKQNKTQCWVGVERAVCHFFLGDPTTTGDSSWHLVVRVGLGCHSMHCSWGGGGSGYVPGCPSPPALNRNLGRPMGPMCENTQHRRSGLVSVATCICRLHPQVRVLFLLVSALGGRGGASQPGAHLLESQDRSGCWVRRDSGSMGDTFSQSGGVNAPFQTSRSGTGL